MATNTNDRGNHSDRSLKRSARRRGRLEKRLMAYSAMTAGVVASAPVDAALQVTTIPDPGLVTPINGFVVLDINGGIAQTRTYSATSLLPGSGSDVVLVNSASTFPASGTYPSFFFQGAGVIGTGPIGTAGIGLGTATSATTGGGTSFNIDAVRRFLPGQQIGGGGTSFYSTGTVAASTSVTSPIPVPGFWKRGDRGFIGVQFPNDANTTFYYGWVDVTLNNDLTLTLHRFAFEDQPGEPAEIPIPEPGSLMMLAMGAAGIIQLRRQRRDAENN